MTIPMTTTVAVDVKFKVCMLGIVMHKNMPNLSSNRVEISLKNGYMYALI